MTKIKEFVRSTRFRVYFILLLVVIVIPFLLNKSIDTKSLSTDKNGAFIPEDHQIQRFSYLLLSDLNVTSENNKIVLSFKVKNNSYVYDFKNLVFTVNYYADENKTNLIASEKIMKESLVKRNEIEVIHESNIDPKTKFWWSVEATGGDIE